MLTFVGYDVNSLGSLPIQIEFFVTDIQGFLLYVFYMVMFRLMVYILVSCFRDVIIYIYMYIAVVFLLVFGGVMFYMLFSTSSVTITLLYWPFSLL